MLGACAPRATLVADPVFAELYLTRGPQRAALEDAARAEGYRLSSVELSGLSPAVEEIEAALGEDGPADGAVILTPVLSAQARGLAAEYPQREMLLLSAPRSGEPGGPGKQPANLSVTRHDRRAAFEELGGRLAARYGGEASGRVVAYFSLDSGSREAELSAFRRGLGGAESAVRFVLLADGGVDLREELFRVRAPGVALVCAFVGVENRLVLEAVEEAGQDVAERPRVATEDLGPGEALPASVLFSIERDYATALARFLAGARGTVTAPARLRKRSPTNGEGRAAAAVGLRRRG
jgi:hypothetical protein